MLAREIYPDLKQRQETLAQYIAAAEQDNIHVSLKTTNFWREKKLASDTLLTVFEHGDKAEAELDKDAKLTRTEFYKEAQNAWEVALKEILIKVNDEIIGPYCLGKFDP